MTAASPDGYRYEHFRTRHLFHDLAFRPSALRAGQPFPDFDLETIDGRRVRKSDLTHDGSWLLITASMTCPNTDASMDGIKRLHAEFGEAIAFVMVDVREDEPSATSRPGREDPTRPRPQVALPAAMASSGR